MGLKLCLHQPCDHITDISAARQFMQGLLQTSAASVLLQVQPCRATEPVTQRLALEGEYPTRLWRSSLSLRAVSLGHWKALLGRTLDREAFITSLRANPDSLGRIITDPLTQTHWGNPLLCSLELTHWCIPGFTQLYYGRLSGLSTVQYRSTNAFHCSTV